MIDRATSGRLHVVGDGQNRVDVTYVGDAANAHLNALDVLEKASFGQSLLYFSGEPVMLWPWLNGILEKLGHPPLCRKIPLGTALFLGGLCESAWKLLGRTDDPPMTRFVAEQMAKDHFFDISAAQDDLGYLPETSMTEALERTIADLKLRGF